MGDRQYEACHWLAGRRRSGVLQLQHALQTGARPRAQGSQLQGQLRGKGQSVGRRYQVPTASPGLRKDIYSATRCHLPSSLFPRNFRNGLLVVKCLGLFDIVLIQFCPYLYLRTQQHLHISSAVLVFTTSWKTPQRISWKLGTRRETGNMLDRRLTKSTTKQSRNCEHL